MDNKPSLSQYFGSSDAPPASQFFDEIGTSPSDMIQSIYLGESEVQPPATITQTGTFPLQPQDDPFNMLSTVSGPFTAGPYSSAVPATSLPDPSTFFDTIGPEPQIGSTKSGLAPPIMTDIIDGLSAKNQPVDREADRRRDAWIPNEEAKKTLMKAQSSPKGSFFPEREVLTMPGIVLEEELADALHSIAVQQLGVSSAGTRGAVRADHVARDDPGLRELLRAGCLRAALNLTHATIAQVGQGAGRMHRPSKHTPRSLQLWLTRFAIMVRIKLHEPLVKEAEPFGDLSKPDMFYQFYPDTYENRTGSIAPFSLRLLLAELPGHVGKPEEAMDRLYAMLSVIKTVKQYNFFASNEVGFASMLLQMSFTSNPTRILMLEKEPFKQGHVYTSSMISNLNEGKTEDGTGVLSSEQDKVESIRLWTGRQTRVQHSIVNCAIALKDYRLASKILVSLKDEAPIPMQKRALASALCRLHLLAGNVRAALAHAADAREQRLHMCPTPDVREYVDLGLIDIAHGKYQDAYNNFARAADQEPTNIMVANNLAVCLLYMGRLKEAIAVLQKAINSDPERGLNESLLINLCTLYELESSKTHEKKLNLLRMLCKHKSDTISNVAECLKLG